MPGGPLSEACFGFPGDPADRFIYATAADIHATLLSKDEHLHEFADRDRRVHVVW